MVNSRTKKYRGKRKLKQNIDTVLDDIFDINDTNPTPAPAPTPSQEPSQSLKGSYDPILTYNAVPVSNYNVSNNNAYEGASNNYESYLNNLANLNMQKGLSQLSNVTNATNSNLVNLSQLGGNYRN